MSTKIIFVRHLETKKDPNLNVALWSLNEEGFKKSEELSESPLLLDAQIIYTSSEIKTVQTIKPLADKLGLPIIQNENLDEVRRGDKFLTKEEFETEKFKQLDDLDYPAFGGETAYSALLRFEKEINKIQNENKDKTIIVVSHGTVLNLYFAKLQNNFNEIHERWGRTEFGALGILKDGKIIRDIVKIQEPYPNIEQFLNKLGFVITFSNKAKISFKLSDDSEILLAEDEFIKIQKSETSTDEDYERIWDLRNKIDKKYFSNLKPLVEKLSEFYIDRKTDYKYQIFLNSEHLSVLSIGPLKLSFEFFGDDNEYQKKIYQELKDFDNFLNS